MDDLSKIRNLEVAADKLLLSVEPQSKELGKEILQALKNRKLVEAEKLLDQARSIPLPRLLKNVLIAHGFAKTAAQAKFLVESRVVFVDDVLQKNVSADVRMSSSLRVGDRIISLGDKDGEAA